MLPTLLLTLSLLPLTHTHLLSPSALPTTSTSQTQGFLLIANLTNPTLDLTPSIQHFTLQAVRVGAGLSTAVLTPSSGRIFFENGTSDSPPGIVSDSDGIYPLSIISTPLQSDQPNSSYVDYIGVDMGTAQTGIGITGGGNGSSYYVPELYLGEVGGGTFIVCNETEVVYGRPQYPVRFAKVTLVDGVAVQYIPGQCVPIRLIAQCAVLGSAVPGAVYNHDYVRSVGCFGDVASVQWG